MYGFVERIGAAGLSSESPPEMVGFSDDFGVTRFAIVFVLYSCPHREPHRESKVERMKMKC